MSGKNLPTDRLNSDIDWLMGISKTMINQKPVKIFSKKVACFENLIYI
jgi:hypothetical protein